MREATRLAAVAVLAGLLVATVPPAAAAEDRPRAERVVRLTDPRITESSGLVVLGDDLVTVNDSGDRGRVFLVDGETGRTLGVTTFSDDPVDIEALAPAGDDAVWVGDIGDNGADRPSVTITSVPVRPGARRVDPPSYRLVYPDGRVHDAETLLQEPTTGRVYLATKEILGGALYAAPEILDPDRPNRLTRVGPVVTTATDGAFLLDGRGLVIRGYFDATLYAWPSLEPLGSFPMPRQRQGEGLAARPDGTLLLSSEGPRSWVLGLSVPADLLARLPAAPTPSAPPADPGAQSAEDGRGDLLVAVGGGAVLLALVVGALLVAARRRRPR